MPWIDYAKVFSICLVVSYHTPPRPVGFGAEVLSILRMPAFFLIAGFLFRADKFPTLTAFLKHRSRQLLVPYVSFSLLFYLLWLLGGREVADGGVEAWRPLVELVTGQPELVIAPFWFLACLFTMQVLYYVLGRVVPGRWLFAVCLALPLLLSVTEVTRVWQLFNALLYLPFYAFANCFKPLIGRLSFRTHGLTVTVAFVAALVLIRTRMWCAEVMSPGLTVDLVRWALFTAAGILLLPAYICACKAVAHLVGARPMVETIGRNTVVVLALHNYVIGVVKILADRVTAVPQFLEGVPWLNLPLTVAVVGALYFPILAIERWMPFLVGRPHFKRRVVVS